MENQEFNPNKKVSLPKQENTVGNFMFSEQEKNIQEVFKLNPELEKIGTLKQYQEYLETIFPDSKVKDILYHSSPNKFSEFDEKFITSTSGDKGVFGRGFYFSQFKEYSKVYGKELKTVIVNIKNLKIIKNLEGINLKENADEGKTIKELYGDQCDGVTSYIDDWNSLVKLSHIGSMEKLKSLAKSKKVNLNFNEDKGYMDVVIPSKEQIHEIGSKQDIENFKNWVKEK